MVKIITCLFFLLSISISGFSQYIPDNSITFSVDGKTLLNPFTGGFNSPQFSGFDINDDGKQDLFVFERTAYKILVFLNISTGTETKFRYAPEYEKVFPVLTDWAILRDYNCDGLPDIFTYNSGSTAVYRAEKTGGELSYVLAEDKLSYVDDIHIPIYTSRSDLPEFTDVNGDGDIDVLTFGVTGVTIRYFENTSQESFWGCDSLQYALSEYCWGGISEGFTCNGADLGIVCKGNVNEDASDARLHVGSTVLALDKDEDGDKDLILGDVTCSNLVYYLNGGDADFANMVSKDTSFPSNTVPAFFHEYLAAFSVDVNNDSYNDLLVSSNDYNFGLNKDNIWYYRNLNTNDTSDFEYVRSDFLADETIDIGADSKPVFTDHNGDGLTDIVIGAGNIYGADGIKHYGMQLFENTGSEIMPAFTFITDDYAGLSTYGIPEMYPAFTDIDADGDIDMFIGLDDGTIGYLQNTAGAGADATYALPQFNYQGIDVGINAAPVFYDVSGDGLKDLIIGEQNGNLNYYKNTGSSAAAVFSLQNENFGGVDVRKPGSLTGNATPFFYRNEGDTLTLLVGSESGYIHRFDEIESSLEGEFHERDTMFLHYLPGNFSTIQAADLHNDGHLEYLTGNNRGGIHIFMRDPDVQITGPLVPEAINIYPNPAHDVLTFETNGTSCTYTISNVLGQVMIQDIADKSLNYIQIDKLEPGIYFFSVGRNDEIKNTLKFIKY